ncbi:MAG: flagellar biosynthesis protein FlhB [Balneolaceae bacterium]|nr:flagellar biosynthesis protein FlhB [Balneolaceae bacterium]
MADKSSDQEKTEEPTARRLEKAREDGQVAMSKEVSSVVLMIAALLMFMGVSGMMYDRLAYLFQSFFYNSGFGFEDQSQAESYLKTALYFGLQIVMPLLTMLLIVTLGVNLAQTKGLFSVKALEFKGKKLNPIEGVKKIISMKGMVELIKGFSKLGIVGIIGYYSIKGDVNEYVGFVVVPIQSSLSDMGGHLLSFVVKVLSALLILSIADAVYQKYEYNKNLKMTKQEIKDEFKQMEGDPHVKGQRKRFGLKLIQQKRMDHAVLASDVVVTNPTHYAVALKYDPEQNNAPIVMVKGQRLRALKIKELAKEYEIPIVENKPVARALFATAEEDQFIPEDLFRVVAEILAYVFKLKNKHRI